MKNRAERSVQRLVELGVCRPSDIKRARDEAAKFSEPGRAASVRNAEKALGAAGNATRIKMMLLLANREICVCEIESALRLAQPTASHHLGVLEQAGLVERSKKGRWVFYKAYPSPTLDVIRKLVPE